ncbi:hypothetical protein Taro_007676 [Colocasia esculenta]|uniref:Uncharacterized protein n=1 Tax=Colocasia esculenta TaxID=4460 RepID=A0A843U4M4_COLES|nr:hypothetical protein [Colocasia esculenta]
MLYKVEAGGYQEGFSPYEDQLGCWVLWNRTGVCTRRFASEPIKGVGYLLAREREEDQLGCWVL